jgi:hypothetical protein
LRRPWGPTRPSSSLPAGSYVSVPRQSIPDIVYLIASLSAELFLAYYTGIIGVDDPQGFFFARYS